MVQNYTKFRRVVYAKLVSLLLMTCQLNAQIKIIQNSNSSVFYAKLVLFFINDMPNKRTKQNFTKFQ